MTYTIPEFKREDIQKRIARISRKAEKYGKSLEVTYGEPYAKEINVYEKQYDWVEGYMTYDHKGTKMVEVFDLTMDSEIVKQDGYTVVARLEHLNEGNVITTFHDAEVKPEWLHLEGRCEHCGTNRARKVTFIVRKDSDGSELQVGRSCLHDYCGISPELVGIFNQIHDIVIGDEYNYERVDWSSHPMGTAYDTVTALAHAIAIHRAYGYVKSSMPHSNKDRISEAFVDHKEVSEEDLKTAIEMAQTIGQMSDEDAIRFLLSDTRTFVRSRYCKETHFGYLAYAPVAYGKYLDVLAERAKREAEQGIKKDSEYVGTVGKREAFDVASYRLVTSWDTQYGTTYLYEFLTTDGNVLIWKASGAFGHWDESGQRFIEEENVTKIKATVKEHKTYGGIKQTIITRTKIA